jgi:hypothetical protein
MRKIEEQMLEAIHTGSDWSKDNTDVVHLDMFNSVGIYLHGHHIATYKTLTKVMTANLKTLAEWPTVTTKSRLRALGVNVATRKGVTYVDNKEVF